MPEETRCVMIGRSDKAIQIPICKLEEFPNHPFKVKEDESMYRLVESINQLGVISPIIVSECEDGKYRIISGHRRKYACELIGLETVPAIVSNADSDTSVVMMVDSNFQRETLLPSEKAKAYRMKHEAIIRRGFRNVLDQESDGNLLSSRAVLAKKSPDSETQIQRFMRLTFLTSELLNMVDERRLSLTAGVEISYLSSQEQDWVAEVINSEQISPNLSQAKLLREMSKDKTLDMEKVFTVMTEKKKADRWNISIPMNKISRYFPKDFTPAEIEESIFILVERWYKDYKRQHGGF
ncbi:MAG: ParB/RepB/Spo0J family partition protein [Clostridia bacterium]|nr:ParB/RepB/Spo0J family partition protein [Clostridia bacterium]